MKNKIFKILSGILLLTMLSSCNSNDDGNKNPEDDIKNKYVILTAEWSVKDGAGYYSVYNKLPTGNVDNISSYTLQSRNYGGFRTFKSWIFNRQKLSGETGIVRYSVGSAGKIEESGFIKCGESAQHLVVDENNGFYFDPERGKTKVQKFNPTSMQRTGEIDFSSIIDKGEDISSNVYTGNQTLLAKEGKLFVNVTYSRKDGSGNNDNTRNYTLAVVDIKSEKIEKIIEHPIAKNHGYSTSEFPAWISSSNGTLYLLTTGWNFNENGIFSADDSFIFRIKAGETDFDKNWILKAEDLGMPKGAMMWSFRELNNKLYVDCSKDAINIPSLSNLNTNIYKFFEVDIETKKSIEISNVPLTVFGLSTGNVEIVDNQVYLRVINRTNNLNGYYKVDKNTHKAEPAFNVSRGGEASGFVKLLN